MNAFQRIQRLYIKTKRDVETLFAGIYRSAFKGRGLEFEEVREYIPGDDVRQIDWNVTARLQHPYIKNFREERELTVMLVIDISSSCRFGSQDRLKSEIIAEIGALLAFSAIKNQDKVGLLLFSNQVELYLKPKKGLKHILRVIRELLYFQPRYRGTSINRAFTFLGKVQKRPVVCFLLSDFLTQEDIRHQAHLIAKRHELILMSITDPLELSFPDVGFTHVQDLETEKLYWVDTADVSNQLHFRQLAQQQALLLKDLTGQIGASLITIQDGISYVEALRRFFKQRRRRR
jgi:uncharacterized protein (DUF58 family)